jgi:hypothetical protein
LQYLLAMAPSTAECRCQASSNTMNGALPPSSSDSFLIDGALCYQDAAHFWCGKPQADVVHHRWRKTPADLSAVVRRDVEHAR